MLMKLLRSHLRPYRKLLLTVVALQAVQTIATLSLPTLNARIIDNGILKHNESYIRSTGAVMLGLGRAMGETIAVALLIGSNAQITSHVFQSGDAMASVIANSFNEATGTYQSALIGLGVVLFAITILVNLGARTVLNRSERRLGTAL